MRLNFTLVFLINSIGRCSADLFETYSLCVFHYDTRLQPPPPPFHRRCSFLFLGTYFYFCMGAHIGMEGHLGDRLRRDCRLMHRFVFFFKQFFLEFRDR